MVGEMQHSSPAEETLGTSDAAIKGRRFSFAATWIVGLLWGLMAVFIWAGSFVLTRLGVQTTLNPYDITALRFAVAGAILVPFAFKFGHSILLVGIPKLIVLIAGTGAPYALLIALGLNYAPASHAAALIPGSMTAMVALIGFVFLADRGSWLRWLGLLLILTGSLLIGGADAVISNHPNATTGHLLFLSAAFLWALYVIVLKRAGLTALAATAIVSVGSCLFYLPVYALFLPVGLWHAPVSDILLQAFYQGALTTVFGLLAFNRAVVILGATGGAAMASLVPAATLILSALILHEFPSNREIAAIALVSVGVLVVTTRKST